MAEDLLGHAVHAAEVAAVGDRDAEVVQRAAEAIVEAHRAILPRFDDGPVTIGRPRLRATRCSTTGPTRRYLCPPRNCALPDLACPYAG